MPTLREGRPGDRAPRWRYDAGAPPGLWRGARQELAEKGFFYVARMAALAAAWPLWRLYCKVFPRSFTFQSASYAYFLHGYNFTWSNERAVEIPIVWAAVRACRGGRVLEVGNVLSHYFACDHEVIDKFERGSRVRNEDAAAFRGAHPYDLIVSISTLEHVGWDEEPRDPGKIARAIANLSGQLAPGGRLLATLPLGYNPSLDAQLAAGALPFSRCRYLRREGLTTWSEADWPAVAGAAYGERWPGTRGLVIAVVDRAAR
jgi:SAM-dependent methyltransferase